MPDREAPAAPAVAGAARPTGRTNPLRKLTVVVEAMRPAHWTKNAFVLAGLIFSGSVLEPTAVLHSTMALVAFCLASGATYLLNDAMDAETDRLNPRTAGRPIARGDLSVPGGMASGAITAVLALVLVAPLGWETPAVVAGYLVLQVAYSTKIKHLVILDVMAVASGFVLRALAGAVAIPVAISEWLLLCTGLLALFLGLAKRKAELNSMQGRPNGTARRVLDDYTPELVDQLLVITAPITVIAYAIYSVIAAATPAMAITVPFVLYGLFRYMYLSQRGVGEQPETAAVHDRPLAIAIVLWGITAALVSYVEPN